MNFVCDTYKYQSINDITKKDHGMREVNVSGHEQGTPNYFTQALKSESFKTPKLRLLAGVWNQT